MKFYKVNTPLQTEIAGEPIPTEEQVMVEYIVDFGNSFLFMARKNEAISRTRRYGDRKESPFAIDPKECKLKDLPDDAILSFHNLTMADKENNKKVLKDRMLQLQQGIDRVKDDIKLHRDNYREKIALDIKL